jgi:hypothetical protein
VSIIYGKFNGSIKLTNRSQFENLLNQQQRVGRKIRTASDGFESNALRNP